MKFPWQQMVSLLFAFFWRDRKTYSRIILETFTSTSVRSTIRHAMPKWLKSSMKALSWVLEQDSICHGNDNKSSCNAVFRPEALKRVAIGQHEAVSKCTKMSPFAKTNKQKNLLFLFYKLLFFFLKNNMINPITDITQEYIHARIALWRPICITC